MIQQNQKQLRICNPIFLVNLGLANAKTSCDPMDKAETNYKGQTEANYS